MKIVCLGDSITKGLGLTLKNRWTSLVNQETDIEMINKGINGDTTSGMLSRFSQDVIQKKPNSVLLLGGLNDILIGGSINYSKANIFAMIHHAKNSEIQPFLGIPPEICHPVKKEWQVLFDEKKVCIEYKALCDWIREIGEIFQVPVVDFRFSLEKENVKTTDFLFEYYLDGIHPNRKGHRMMANVVKKFLNKDHELMQ